jgi:hypothetical protein
MTIKGNDKKEIGGCRSVLRKLWQCIWNSGGSISDCPKKKRSAQDVRDEYLKKCPWLDNQL